MYPTMLSVGLDPTLAGTSPSARTPFPELDHDTILAGAEAGYAELRSLGFEIDRFLVDDGPAAATRYRAALAERSYDYIDIGAGIRLDPDRTHLFETLVDISVEMAPSATLVFDTGPTTKADAIRRWFPRPAHS